MSQNRISRPVLDVSEAVEAVVYVLAEVGDAVGFVDRVLVLGGDRLVIEHIGVIEEHFQLEFLVSRLLHLKPEADGRHLGPPVVGVGNVLV